MTTAALGPKLRLGPHILEAPLRRVPGSPRDFGSLPLGLGWRDRFLLIDNATQVFDLGG